MIVRELLTLLGFQSNPEGAKAYEDKLRDTQRQAERTSTRVGDAFRGMGNRLNQFHTSVANGLDRVSSVAEATSSALGGIVSTLGGGITAMGLASITSEYTDLHSRLQIAVGDMADATEVMRDLKDIANLTWQPINQTIQGFLGMRLPLEELGLTIKEQQQVLLAVNDSLTVGAIKGDQAARAQMWLNRALGEGKVSAGGFNELMEAADPIMDDLQKHLGLTTSEFQRMGRSGELTAQMLVEYFQKAGPRLRQQSENMAVTVMDAFQRLRTNFEFWIFEVDKAIGVSSKFADIILWFADRPAIAGIAAIGVLTLGFAALTAQIIATGAAALATGWKMLKAGALMLANPMTWVWIAVAAAIVGVILLIEDLYTWINGGDSVLGRWLGSWEAFSARITAEWNQAWENIKKGFANIGQAWSDLLSWMGGIVSSIGDWFSPVLEPVTSAMTWLFGDNGSLYNAILLAIPGAAIVALWKKIWDALPETVRERVVGIFEPLTNAWNIAVDFLREKWSGFWDWVTGGIASVGDRIGNWFESASQGSSQYGTRMGPGGVPLAPGQTTIPGFAKGTNNAPRGLALVGEDGPELVNFLGGEQVIPNSRPATGRGLGVLQETAASLLSGLQARLTAAGPTVSGAIGGATRAAAGPLLAASAAVAQPAVAYPSISRSNSTVVNTYNGGNVKVEITREAGGSEASDQDLGEIVAEAVEAKLRSEFAAALSHFADPEE